MSDFEVITCNEDPFASYLLLLNQGSWPISISVMSQMHRLERRETYAGSDGLLFTMPWLQWDPWKFDTSSSDRTVLYLFLFSVSSSFVRRDLHVELWFFYIILYYMSSVFKLTYHVVQLQNLKGTTTHTTGQSF